MSGYQLDTTDGLARLRRARERFLGERVVPDDLPDWLATAWRRSLLFHGVDVECGSVPAATTPCCDPALVSAARPVLDRLAENLAGLGVAIVLADARSRILECWATEDAVRHHLERIDTRPGADLSEPSTGTNGISHVIDTRSAAVIGGPQHLFGLYQSTVCAGAPIRNPVTRKVTGALALVCDLDAPLRLLTALTGTAGAGIERELLHAASPHERRLLECYLAARAGGAAVAVLDGRTRIVSDRAAALLRPRDLDSLEAHAMTHPSERTLTISDTRITVRLRPLIGDASGVLVTVSEPAPPRRSGPRTSPVPDLLRRAGLVGASRAWLDLERATARVGSGPLLISGEPGVGKTAVARALAGQPSPDRAPALLDPPVTGDGWIARLRGALDSADTVVLRHVERLAQPLVEPTIELLGAYPHRWVIATCRSLSADSPWRTCWAPGEIVVPTLRERTEDITALAEHFAQQGRRVDFAQDARAALLRHHWPGNVAELKALVEAVTRAPTGGVVAARDLPQRLHSSPGKALTDIERAERDAIAEALRATVGNRKRAANRLGIGRATIYRKIRRYGLG